jgi:hypothetical protein
MAEGDKTNGLRNCKECESHADVREDIVKATKDLEYVCNKMDRQCTAVENLYQEVDKRLKVRPFYALVSALIIILIFMLGIQINTHSTVGAMEKNLEIVKYEIKADIARHEGETNQLIQRVDDVTSEQKVLMDNVIQHIHRNGQK